MRHSNAEPTLQAADRAELRDGKIVLRTAAQRTNGRAAVRGLVQVPVSPGQAWALLEQWERMHEMLPALRLHVVRRWSDATGDRHELVAAELSVGPLKTRYAVRATFRPSELKQWWSLIADDELRALRKELPGLPTQSRMIRSTDGTVSVHALEEGCLIQHDNHLVPHPTVPRAIENLLSRQLVRELLTAVRRDLLAPGSVPQTTPGQESPALDRLVGRV